MEQGKYNRREITPVDFFCFLDQYEHGDTGWCAQKGDNSCCIISSGSLCGRHRQVEIWGYSKLRNGAGWWNQCHWPSRFHLWLATVHIFLQVLLKFEKIVCVSQNTIIVFIRINSKQNILYHTLHSHVNVICWFCNLSSAEYQLENQLFSKQLPEQSTAGISGNHKG